MSVDAVTVITENWLIESDDYGNFVIDSEVINVLISYRQLRKHDFEAGGALIGCLREDNIMEVNDLTLPQPSDKRTKYSFFRSNAHNKILNDKWKASNGNAYLVGLWHTHPEPTPKYSNEDNKDWHKVLKQGHYEGQSLIFIIVGQKDIRLWVSDNKNYKTSLVGEYSLEE
ncbi:Mov34/MPN/PAD-1 family protein [uncultured Shewanella sp.]|uniref:Mov34/MPN/PAD-1 family protein n=1 Tax=uncultured Shewanella sp. TaxID=173975 RepID=UPI003703B275